MEGSTSISITGLYKFILTTTNKNSGFIQEVEAKNPIIKAGGNLYRKKAFGLFESLVLNGRSFFCLKEMVIPWCLMFKEKMCTLFTIYKN